MQGNAGHSATGDVSFYLSTNTRGLDELWARYRQSQDTRAAPF